MFASQHDVTTSSFYKENSLCLVHFCEPNHNVGKSYGGLLSEHHSRCIRLISESILFTSSDLQFSSVIKLDIKCWVVIEPNAESSQNAISLQNIEYILPLCSI